MHQIAGPCSFVIAHADNVLHCNSISLGWLWNKPFQDIKGVAEQWSFVPHVVNELLKLDGGGKGAALPKEQLCQLAAKCKKIYQAEFARVDIDGKNKDKHRNDSHVTEHRRKTKSEDDHYDSDETIEMTEEEIDFACRQLPGLCGWYSLVEMSGVCGLSRTRGTSWHVRCVWPL